MSIRPIKALQPDGALYRVLYVLHFVPIGLGHLIVA